MLAAFSMASMTDVIFLLLIFFMVTSTFIFPTALEVNLPQSSEQTAIKPATTVYIDAEQNLYATFGGEEPQPMSPSALITFLTLAKEQDPEGYIALYADKDVPYGKVVENTTSKWCLPQNRLQNLPNLRNKYRQWTLTEEIR